jgi:hypothetical protein
MRALAFVIIISVTLQSASNAHAMTIVAFDQMADDDQDEYVADLVVGTQHVLDAAGRHQESVKVHDLFTRIKPGDKISDGMSDFEILLPKARVADDLRVQNEPNARRLEVEDAMALTLRKNGIEVPDAFFTVISNFQPKHPPRQ